MASKYSPKGACRVQKSTVSGSVSPSEKSQARTTCQRTSTEQNVENGKSRASPKPGSAMPTQQGSPSGKKGHSPVSNASISTGSSSGLLNLNMDRTMNSVSPGRHCMSDSKLSVRPSRNIPVSNSHKRKINLEEAGLVDEPMVSAEPQTKRRKSCIQPLFNSHLSSLPQSQKALKVDWNQNEKNFENDSIGKRRASWSEISADSYKSLHSIGSRKAATKVPRYSEQSVAANWKELSPNSPKGQNNHKQSQNVEMHIPGILPTNTQIQNGCLSGSPTSNGDHKQRPSYSHSISNDSVFEDGMEVMDSEDRFEKVDSEVAFNRTSGLKNGTLVGQGKGKAATGRMSPRVALRQEKELARRSPSVSVEIGNDNKRKRKESVSESIGSESIVSSCTEDSFTDDSSVVGRTSPEDRKPRKRRNKYADILPRAPRARREASLTAETKVHLLYERDDMDKMPLKKPAAKKPRISQSDNGTVPKDLPNDPPNDGNKEHRASANAESEPKVKLEGTVEKCITNGHFKEENEVVKPKKSASGTQSPTPLGEGKTCAKDRQALCDRCGKPIRGQKTGHYATGLSSVKAVQSSLQTKSIKDDVKRVNSVQPSADQLQCSCPAAQRSISEPASDNTIVDKVIPLLGQPRRASVDAAECEKLNASLKNAFLIRMSRHSIDAPIALASQLDLELIQQLGLLQPGNLPSNGATPNGRGLISSIPPANGGNSTVTESVTTKSKTVRKVVTRPNLKPFQRRKATNGWRGEGEPTQKPVIINNEAIHEVRYCYESIRRKDDVIRIRDCVLLRAGTRKRDLPYVAKVAAIYEDPDTGDLMTSLLWYYRPEHTEAGRLSFHLQAVIPHCAMMVKDGEVAEFVAHLPPNQMA
ncbi:uncharacterized protein [Diadema setosum]|uniref:uncharacterized protein n=1 Tax=Diadema setosum TaxID=31175 RepID=UPI003B3A8B4C